MVNGTQGQVQPTPQDFQRLLTENPLAAAQLRAIVFERLYLEGRKGFEEESESKSEPDKEA
ncbi:hypothetical protein LCGC14_0458140 [marine sediment metagenome]|uniref:Uncharacterized protein n=1 Tax=marine sediment metagenome TaxID=412755 RepID=A0A0F9V2S0_9ZZZZ